MKILYLSLFILGLFAVTACGHGYGNQEYSGDWLGIGPIYPYGPLYSPMYYGSAYYMGWEDYPIYSPVYYPVHSANYYPDYDPYYYPNYYSSIYYSGDRFPLGTFGMRHGGNY